MKYKVKFHIEESNKVLIEELPFKPESFQNIIIENVEYMVHHVRYDITNKQYVANLYQ